jgi:acylphosphatase
VETRRCVVRGRVQGVAFRYFVVRHARDLGVRGTVRNRADGAVEAVLQAEAPEAIAALIERIRQGPRAASVEAVEVESVEDEKRYDDFEVVR